MLANEFRLELTLVWNVTRAFIIKSHSVWKALVFSLGDFHSASPSLFAGTNHFTFLGFTLATE